MSKVFGRENVCLICDELDRILSDPGRPEGLRIDTARKAIGNLREWSGKSLMSRDEFYLKQQELALERDPATLRMINRRLEMLKESGT